MTETVEVASEEAAPVTFDGFSTTDIPALDPQIATDSVGINYIENLFVHLTNYDLVTSEVVPEAATSWEISDYGLLFINFLWRWRTTQIGNAS